MHVIQIFFVGSVEPIWRDPLGMSLGTLANFSLCVTLIQETAVEFGDGAHEFSSVIIL